MKSTSKRSAVQFTKLEAQALLAVASAGEFEFTDVVKNDPDTTPRQRTARLTALERAMNKLKDLVNE